MPPGSTSSLSILTPVLQFESLLSQHMYALKLTNDNLHGITTPSYKDTNIYYLSEQQFIPLE
jgi:hypothetical protein